MARQARRLLEEIDTVVARVNETGVGKLFLTDLRGVLQRELILSVTRLDEPSSQGKAIEGQTREYWDTRNRSSVLQGTRSSRLGWILHLGRVRR